MTARTKSWRRTLPWAVLILLIALVQVLFVWFTQRNERQRAAASVEQMSLSIAANLRQAALDNILALDELSWRDPSEESWQTTATRLLRTRRALLRIERRDLGQQVVAALDSTYESPVLQRDGAGGEASATCREASRRLRPVYSNHHAVTEADGMRVEVLSLCLPIRTKEAVGGFLVGTFKVRSMVTHAAGPATLNRSEISILNADGVRFVRIGDVPSAGLFVSSQPVALPGTRMMVSVDLGRGPAPLPGLAVVVMTGLSIAVTSVVGLLMLDVRRRAAAERALAESLAFRQSMEDSMITGLLVREIDGPVRFVNPAFRDMVGFDDGEIIGAEVPPYWPPELVGEYLQRRGDRAADTDVRTRRSRAGSAGFETLFVRGDGTRFPVRIFEAPLIDARGRHTGWMSTVLDLSAQRRLEELARQQQERLQATARLATVGEMASLLSHELNQPLFAIASYATGSVLLMEERPTHPDTQALVREGSRQIAEEADRAGRIIRSIHNFVRRRNRSMDPVDCADLIDVVLPLIRLHATKSNVRVEVDMQKSLPRVTCDRTMIEQVLINLSRNGLQAIEEGCDSTDRVLTLEIQQRRADAIAFSVIDVGSGMTDEVMAKLFTPFFTTRPEGMGLGLSLCRTIIEQHGGRLDFSRVVLAEGREATRVAFELRVAKSPIPEGAT